MSIETNFFYPEIGGSLSQVFEALLNVRSFLKKDFIEDLYYSLWDEWSIIDPDFKFISSNDFIGMDNIERSDLIGRLVKGNFEIKTKGWNEKIIQNEFRQDRYYITLKVLNRNPKKLFDGFRKFSYMPHSIPFQLSINLKYLQINQDITKADEEKLREYKLGIMEVIGLRTPKILKNLETSKESISTKPVDSSLVDSLLVDLRSNR